jgi:biotin carboxyl carrier protein
MRQLFLLGDQEHELGLTRPDARYRLHLRDAVLTVALDDAGPGACNLTIDGTVVPARVAVDGDTIYIHLDGAVHEVRYVDPVTRYVSQSGAAAQDVAAAPMPGTVVALHVSPGQSIRRGEPLLVIESMKLEMAIKAPRDGIVATVHVLMGQTFDRGAYLVTLLAETMER